MTHIDEPTLDLCLEHIGRQTFALSNVKVVSGVSPAFNAFNMALDHAHDVGADVLVHLAADVLLAPDAIQKLISCVDLEKYYAVIGNGFDIFNGERAPIGLWALNMKVISNKFRFADVYKMDIEFCNRIEEQTGLVRRKVKKSYCLGYHHPIWTPQEIYIKFRYNSAKYKSKILRSYLSFFERALMLNPSNVTLKIGRVALMRGWAEASTASSPERYGFMAEFEELSRLHNLQGSEFYAYHQDMIEVGYRIFGGQESLVPSAGCFFSTKKKKKKYTKGKQEHTERKRFLINLTRPKFHLYRLKAIAARLFRLLPSGLKDRVRVLTGRPARNIELRMSLSEAQRMGVHGEINVGNVEWECRWEKAPKHRRVLMVAPKDFAGSMYKWAEALNRFSDFAARLVTFEVHQYGYSVDLVVPECNAQRKARVLALAEAAGILHLKDEHSWYLNSPNFTNLPLLQEIFFSPRFLTTPKIFTHYGGYARKFKAEERYILAVQKFDARIAMTPDLNYQWFNGEFIPHAIDVDSIPFGWSDTSVLCHSPSSPEKKATYMLEETLLVFKQNPPLGWEKWAIDLINGVSHKECMQRKKSASLFFDQAGRHRVADLGIDDVIGWYGNSAIEAMAFGIPTIAHMSEQAFFQAKSAGICLSDIPVINMERSRDGLMNAIRGFVESSPEERLELAEMTRAFTVAFHGYEAVANRLAACYQQTLNKTSLNKEIST